MEVDASGAAGGLTATPELTCFAHKKAGSWDRVAEAREGRPCGECNPALVHKRKKKPKCRWVEVAPPRVGKRGTRNRDPEPEDTEPGTYACNQVINIVTGERRDGGTCCKICRDALYDPNSKDTADYVDGEPGDGTEPCNSCLRTKSCTIHCPPVSNALLKLEVLFKSRAAGNR
jgi:hypothetical protein